MRISDEMIKFQLDNDLVISFLFNVIKVIMKGLKNLRIDFSQTGRQK